MAYPSRIPAAAAAFAQSLSGDSSASWKPFRQRDFTGGENRSILPELMQPNQLLMALNCIMTADGLLQTRLGKRKINLTSIGEGPILGVWRWGKEDGTTYVTVQHGTSLYNIAWDGTTPFESFPVAIRDDLEPNIPLEGRIWKDNLILANGVDAPFRFDGVTCTDLVDAPLFYRFCIYAGRIWCIPVAASSCIQHCELEDYDTWDALDIYKIRTGDGDVLTALSPQNGGIMAFKSKSCWPVFGTDRFNISIPGPISDSVGCVAPRSVLNDGLFLGNDGLYQFDLQNVTLVAKSHKPLLDILPLADREAAIAVPVPADGRAVLSFPSGLCLNIEARYNGITTWSGLNASCFAVCNAAGDDGGLIVGDATNGIIYRLDDIANDDGVAIQTEIQTAYSDAGSLRDKIWRLFRPEIEPIGGNEIDAVVITDEEANYLNDEGGNRLILEAIQESSRLVRYRLDLNYGVFLKEKGVDLPAASTLTYGSSDWGSIWGIIQRINTPWHLFGVRGSRISFSVASATRIKFLGYVAKYTEVGYL